MSDENVRHMSVPEKNVCILVLKDACAHCVEASLAACSWKWVGKQAYGYGYCSKLLPQFWEGEILLPFLFVHWYPSVEQPYDMDIQCAVVDNTLIVKCFACQHPLVSSHVIPIHCVRTLPGSLGTV